MTLCNVPIKSLTASSSCECVDLILNSSVSGMKIGMKTLGLMIIGRLSLRMQPRPVSM